MLSHKMKSSVLMNKKIAFNKFQNVMTEQSLMDQVLTMKATGYQDWVHHAKFPKTSLKMFDSAFLEFNSHTPWYIIPIVWCPLIMLGLYITGINCHVLMFMALGLIAWAFTEYFLHRFIFHAHTESKFMNMVHFMFHGIHHRTPSDKTRLVFPPLPGLIFIYAPIWLIMSIVMSHIPHVALMTGFTIGYVIYDLTHYALHHGKFKTGIMGWLTKHHFNHHFTMFGQESNFGVSLLGKAIDFLMCTHK